MSKSKLVRISPETLQKIGKKAKPFESPNDCINRILTESGTPCDKISTENVEHVTEEEEK